MLLRSLGVLRGLLGSMRRVFGTTLEWSWRVGRLRGSLLGGLWIAQGCPREPSRAPRGPHRGYEYHWRGSGKLFLGPLGPP